MRSAALTFAIAMIVAAFVLSAAHRIEEKRALDLAAAAKDRLLIVQIFGDENAVSHALTMLRAAPETASVTRIDASALADQLAERGLSRFSALDLANLPLLQVSLEARAAEAGVTDRLNRQLTAAGLNVALYGGPAQMPAKSTPERPEQTWLSRAIYVALALALLVMGILLAGERPYRARAAALEGRAPLGALGVYGALGFAAGVLAGLAGVTAAALFSLSLLLWVEPSLSWMGNFSDATFDWANSHDRDLATVAGAAPILSGLLLGLGAAYGAWRIYKRADRRAC